MIRREWKWIVKERRKRGRKMSGNESSEQSSRALVGDCGSVTYCTFTKLYF